MKRIFALFLAVLYLVFTTFGVVQMSSGTGIAQNDPDEAIEYALMASDDAGEPLNQQMLTNMHLTKKAPKHLHASGKIKLPRNSYVVLLFKKAFSFSPGSDVQLNETTALPNLYHASLFLRHGVLRI